jgi:hypothetical protein
LTKLNKKVFVIFVILLIPFAGGFNNKINIGKAKTLTILFEEKLL